MLWKCNMYPFRAKHLNYFPPVTFTGAYIIWSDRSARPLGRLNVAVPSQIKLFGILPGPAHFRMSAPDSSAGSPDSSSIPMGHNLRFQWRDDRKWGAANPALVYAELKDGEHRTACQGCSPCMDLVPRLTAELKKALPWIMEGDMGRFLALQELLFSSVEVTTCREQNAVYFISYSLFFVQWESFNLFAHWAYSRRFSSSSTTKVRGKCLLRFLTNVGKKT